MAFFIIPLIKCNYFTGSNFIFRIVPITYIAKNCFLQTVQYIFFVILKIGMHSLFYKIKILFYLQNLNIQYWGETVLFRFDIVLAQLPHYCRTIYLETHMLQVCCKLGIFLFTIFNVTRVQFLYILFFNSHSSQLKVLKQPSKGGIRLQSTREAAWKFVVTMKVLRCQEQKKVS